MSGIRMSTTVTKFYDLIPLPRFFRQIVEALCFLHAHGIVHRDIKDENIIVDTRTLEVKIIDFGSGAALKETHYHKFEGNADHDP